ncbi:hypothetical protein wTpre_136 [Wolbachia endosymbiont of Trichogramma pretiosum]|nr:hypothetical protein wTpre_136 [Wolbachia endosymbiont of Trichogramma pretiosum]
MVIAKKIKNQVKKNINTQNPTSEQDPNTTSFNDSSFFLLLLRTRYISLTLVLLI